MISHKYPIHQRKENWAMAESPERKGIGEDSGGAGSETDAVPFPQLKA